VQQSDVTADFKDGMLEVRVPIPKESATKVPVTKR
jgi:HSP20 family molecular chaperone IbpA